jgi:hypothetical protein
MSCHVTEPKDSGWVEFGKDIWFGTLTAARLAVPANKYRERMGGHGSFCHQPRHAALVSRQLMTRSLINPLDCARPLRRVSAWPVSGGHGFSPGLAGLLFHASPGDVRRRGISFIAIL